MTQIRAALEAFEPFVMTNVYGLGARVAFGVLADIKLELDAGSLKTPRYTIRKVRCHASV